MPRAGSLPTENLSPQEQLLSRNAERFRGGLVYKAHRLFFHSALGSRVIKKKGRERALEGDEIAFLVGSRLGLVAQLPQRLHIEPAVRPVQKYMSLKYEPSSEPLHIDW